MRPRHRARRLELVRGATKAELAGADRALPAGAGRSLVAPIPRSGVRLRLGLDARPRPCRQRGVDTAAGDLRPRRLGRATQPSPRPAPPKSGSPTAQEDALVHWCTREGLEARPLDMVGYGEEEEGEPAAEAERHEPLRRTARPPRLRAGRNAKLRLIAGLFAQRARSRSRLGARRDDRRALLPHAKPGLIRALIAERTDPVLFALSYDYVGDLSETVALMWPARPKHRRGRAAIARPRSSKTLPRSARRNCRRISRAGSTGSTRPGAGRC